MNLSTLRREITLDYRVGPADRDKRPGNTEAGGALSHLVTVSEKLSPPP